MFLELPKSFNKLSIPIGDLGKISQILKERFNFIYGDAHGIAFLLDPRYLGQGMDNETRKQVKDFITQWHGIDQEEATMLEIIKYLGTAHKYTIEVKLIDKKQLSVFQFWNGLSQFPLLREVAFVVFAASCSSAAAERNFSAHKFVHSQARNRLRCESVEKLVFLFFNSKNFDKEELDFYEMIDDLADVSEEEDVNNEDADYEYY